MSRIYMIRHGKPASTWGGEGEPDPGLDPIGAEQAQAVGRLLMALPQAERPTTVISSPLRRCRETAAPFAEMLGVPVEIEPRVGEIPTPAALSLEERPAWLRTAFGGHWDQIVGDLDYAEWRRSVVEAVRARPGCAVFSHFVAINAVVSALEGGEGVLTFQPDHTSVTILDLVDGRLSLIERGREAQTRIL